MNAIWKPAATGNFKAGRASAISQITFHHIAGDAPGAIDRFQIPGVEVSATYVIGSDGTLYQTVKESDTPYTDGNAASNARSITIEHAGGIASVPYTDAMYRTSAALVRDLIARYGITSFKRHRDVIDLSAYPGGTECPGKLDVERILTEARGGSIMIPDLAHLDSMFQRFFGRNSTPAEQAEWIGKKSYTELIDVLIGQQAYKDQIHFTEVGYTAVTEGWEDKLKSVSTQGAATTLQPGLYKVA